MVKKKEKSGLIANGPIDLETAGIDYVLADRTGPWGFHEVHCKEGVPVEALGVLAEQSLRGNIHPLQRDWTEEAHLLRDNLHIRVQEPSQIAFT